MTLSLNSIGYLTMSNYIDAMWNQNENKLSDLLSENVSLRHKTNGTEDATVSGREKVIELSKERFFKRIQSIDLKNIKSTPNELHPEFEMQIEEIMEENEGKRRIFYHDHTTFTLVKEGDRYLISDIVMSVTKKYLVL